MAEKRARCAGWALLLTAATLCCLVRPGVPQPPQITEHPDKEYDYREGSGGSGFDVVLPCKARGEPEPSYFWQKDGVNVSTDSININIKMGEGTMSIARPSDSDEGIYQCFAHNDYGTALSSRAVLRKAYLEPFSYTSRSQHHKPTVGEYLNLRCSPPKSYPTGSIYWSQIGSDVKGTKTRLRTDDRITIDYDGNLYFANIMVNDSVPGLGTYVCSIHNGKIKGTMDGGQERLQVQLLHDQSSPPFRAPKLQWHTPNPTVAIKGKDHKMKCIFSGYPTPAVTWTRMGGKELPSGHAKNDAGMELALTNIDWADAGMYRCSAVTPNMPNSIAVHQDFELTVESAPYFIRQMRDITASEEEPAVFECDVSGVPKPTIQWSVNGDLIGAGDKHPRRTVDGSVVEYTNLTKTDSEVLQCNASNKHGYIFNNVYLNVLAEAPSFIKVPEPALKVAEGQMVNLTCQVFGHPRPKISWLKDEQSISGFGHMTIRPDDEDMANGGNLTINAVRKSDEGLYTCQAHNKFGNESESGRLIVRDPTVITSGPKDTTVNATKDVTLTCDAETDEKEKVFLTITWLRNGKEIDYENEPRVNKNTQDNSLIISRVTVDDTAEYTCVASNGLDKDEQTVHVTVKDRPDPPKNVRLRECVQDAKIKWEAGNENNEEVIKYIVYYNTSFDEPDIYKKAVTADRAATTALISLSPWANYTFHVRARNSLGVSDRSAFTSARCQTPPQIPYKNPENVCSNSKEPDELVITWDIMEKIDHNGPGFEYLVHYRQLDIASRAPNSDPVTDWRQGQYVVKGQETFRQYEIYVTTKNVMGPSPTSQIKRYIGYSGEGIPKDSPANFAVDEDSLNSTSVIFTWDPVDESPDNIQGHFIGYEVVYWRADQPDDKRYHLVELNEAVGCKDMEGGRRRRARRQAGDGVYAHISDLWPYSTIVAGVSVRNGKSSGQLSPTIEFTTPQGAPSIVPMFEVRERGSHHFGVSWAPPLFPNGIITGYVINWQKSDRLDDPMGEKEILDPFKRTSTIKDLNDNQDYRLYISARTEAGPSIQMIIEDKTLIAGNPDIPGIGFIEVEETSVNVSWVPTDEEEMRKNPGSDFYVEYKKSDDPDDVWESAQPQEEDQHWANISGLDFGKKYQFRIVAVNGAGQETRSAPTTVQVGQKAGTTDETTEFSTIDLTTTDTMITTTDSVDPVVDLEAMDDPGVSIEPGVSVDLGVSIDPVVPSVVSSLVPGIDSVERNDSVDSVPSSDLDSGADLTPTGPTVDVTTDPGEVVMPSIARAGWFIGMMCAILFLLIVLIIVCLIKRNRGGKYPVHEKEKLRGRDPDRDDEERGFGEYTKTPYMELKSDEPDYKKSAGSLESESKPLDLSDSDSMAEYEDTDPSKFNEDGSFIGQYGGKKTKSKEKIEPDATSPSALSTFV